MKRLRILYLTRNLPPIVGGMEKLNLHMIEQLAGQHDLIVCGPAGAGAHFPAGVKSFESPVAPLSRFLISNSFQALKAAKSFRPNLVIAGSGLTAPAAYAAARLSGARTLAYLHGLDIVADHAAYRLIWRPFLRRMQTIVVNSRNTGKLAESIGISPAKVRVLHPGVSMPARVHDAAATFRRQFGLGHRPLLLSLGRLTERKGLAEFVGRCLPPLVRQFPDLALVVIGGEATQALKVSSGQGARIQAAAADAGVEENIVQLGPQNDATVDAAFAASRALIFPVLELPGDVEGFGMVAVEAAAHGVPTVAFAAGGVADAVADPQSGRLIAPGDYPAMTAAIAAALSKPPTASGREGCLEFAQGFAWSRFGTRLEEIVQSDCSRPPSRLSSG